MDSAKSNQTRVSHEYSERTEEEPSVTSLLPSLEVGISGLDILRGKDAIWTLGPPAPRPPPVQAIDILKWAQVLESKKDDAHLVLNETKALLKHMGVPLDMGPYENWVLNLEEAKVVDVILTILPQLDPLAEDYELSMRAANLLRLIAKSLGGREGVWEEYKVSLWETASDIIERHQDNMFGRRNLAFLCLETGNWKDANRLFDRAIQDMRDEKAMCGKAIALRKLDKKHDSLKWFQEASKKNPNHPNIWRDMGDLLLEIGQTQEAIDCFRAALKLRPTWGEVWEIMGYAYEEAGNMDESRECLAKASVLLPSTDRREEWMIYKAALSSQEDEPVVPILPMDQIDAGELEEERRLLDAEKDELERFGNELEIKEKELHSKDKELEIRETSLEQQKIEAEMVANLLARTASLDRDNILSFWKEGYTTLDAYRKAEMEELMETGHIDETAAKRIKDLLADGSDFSKDLGGEQILIEDAMAYLEEGKLEEALDSLNTITKNDPENEEAWFNKAEVYTLLKKPKEALSSYERALELNPKNPRAWMEKANLLMQEGFAVEAIRSLRRFVELDPENVEYLRERAETYSLTRDFGNAILCYNSILQAKSEDVDALIGVGDAMFSLSDVEEADRFFQKAIRLAPGDERAWCKRAHVLNRKGRWGAAIQLYNRSIALKWNYSEPWIGKAEIHLRQGSYEDAVQSYDRATKISPNNAFAWHGKGLAYEKMGDYDEAEMCFKKALKLDKHLDIAQEGLERVGSVKEVNE